MVISFSCGLGHLPAHSKSVYLLISLLYNTHPHALLFVFNSLHTSGSLYILFALWIPVKGFSSAAINRFPHCVPSPSPLDFLGFD